MKKIFMMLVIWSVLLVGCSSEEKDLRDQTHSITFSGLGLDETYTLEQLYQLPLTEVDSTRLTSTQETIVSKIKGIDVNYFLEKAGKTLSDVGSVRLIASDGYLAEVPRELLSQSRLFIVLEEDGKFLDHEDEIVKSGLIDQRSLYWVRLLSRVEFTEPLPERSFKQWYFDTSLKNQLTPFDFDVYIYKEQAVFVLDILDLIKDDSDVVVMSAKDGLTKVERRSDLKDTVIVLTGEGSPMFTAKDIGKGREVKSIFTLDTLTSRVIFTDFLESSFTLSTILGETLDEVEVMGDTVALVNPNQTECVKDEFIRCDYQGQIIENIRWIALP